MPTIRFRGKVLPAVAVVNTARLDLLWPEPDGSPSMRIVVQVINSIVEVECTLQKYDPDDDISLPHTRSLELVRSTIDCIAFHDGMGLTTVLEEVISPAGVVTKLLAQNKYLIGLCTAFDMAPTAKPENNFDAMYRLVVNNPDLFMAMNDLIVAITLPGQIAVNCGRAIEGLRKILVPLDPTRKLGWAALQSNLNIDRSYREFITKASANPRHGDRSDIPQQTGQELLKRSWVIMNRFLEYKKRGSQPLPIADFPVLT